MLLKRFFNSPTPLSGYVIRALGTDTLYLGVVLARRRGGLRDRLLDLVLLGGLLERFLEAGGLEPRVRSLSRLLSLSLSRLMGILFDMRGKNQLLLRLHNTLS